MKSRSTIAARTKAACVLFLALGLAACDFAPAPVGEPGIASRTLERVTFSETHRLKIKGDQPVEQLVASVLNIAGPLQYGQFAWNDQVPRGGKVWVLVNLQTQTISVFRGAHEIGTAVALYGVDGKPTPLGRFKVLDMRKDHQSSIYDAEMPFTLRLTNDGIAIHGSDVRAGVGTHGCVGIPLEFASKLFGAAEIGTEVFMVRSSGVGAAPLPVTPVGALATS